MVESFEAYNISATQAKVSLRTTDLAIQLLKIKDQYKRLIKLTETMESAKCTIKEAVQAIQELDFGKDTFSISCYIQKRMLNNDVSKIINIERPDISLLFTFYFNILSPQWLLWKDIFPSCENCWSRTET